MQKIILKKIIGIFITIVVIFNCSTIVAEGVESNDDIRFKNITVNDGLSQGSVYSILQDSNGYMWFGTNDGLNRYDGYSFEVLKGSDKEADKLYSGIVGSVIEDSEKNIWVGASGGLAKVDSKTLVVERIEVDSDDKNKISNNHILDIYMDSYNDIWIGTENGLNLYDKKMREFTKFFNIDEEENSLSNNFVNSITEGLQDEIWIGTKNGLNILDKKTGIIKRINKENTKAFKSNNIVKVYKDIGNNIWISTQEEGLVKYNRVTNSFEDVKEINEKFGTEKYAVNSIYEDAVDNIWFGSKGGLIQYSKIDKSVKKYKKKYYDTESLINNSIQSVYRDKGGIMWIGTYDGISIFNPKETFEGFKNDPLKKNSLSSNSISGMYEDYEGDIWMGTTNDGINLVHRESGEIEHFKVDSLNENSISSNTIYEITGNKEDIWIGSKNGLNRINKKSRTIKKYFKENKENTLISNDIKSLYLFEERYLWIGTRDGLDIYDIHEDKYINLNYIFENGNVGETFVRRIFKDSKNNFWIGMGWNGGLIKIDTQNKKVKYYKSENKDSIKNNAIKGIAEDLEGDIWITTSEGIEEISESGIRALTEKDGLINNYAYGILVDEENNIWISTNGGISKFDQKKNSFSNYTIVDGISSNEFNGTSELKTRDGKMFFGSINGVTAFYPRKIKEIDKEKLKVAIGDIEVFNKNNYIYQGGNLELKHNENNFSIEFFMPSYSKLGNWNYEYILEGFDEEWISSKNRNYVRYTNLSPGKYEFKVRARYGIESVSEETKVQIVVAKAWYESNIAYVIYLLTVILIIYLILNRVKILENLVNDRTNKLNKELREKEKIYKELLKIEKFRNTYLVNLSHELRTPLNVILSSEQLINSLNEEEKIDKRNLKKYMEIIGKNSRGLLKVINDLIDSSKIQSGAYKLEYSEVDIVYLVEETALSMRSYIEQNGLELIIDPEIEEKMVECSKDDIERCVINLISNAIKFTEKGKIYISIKETEDDYIKIIIEDSGIGISKEQQSIIFDRFATLETGISSKHCSSGIGLTLVKNIVELHKGTIRLKSEVGVGSRFTIILPIKKK
ncbi:sensor histidine kinase [uncultured Clostridium sp.]|uniref:sensor histidine kinase n=1 Tax=uncultured Clostridium sp. TaxID=59620 RepID=UPI00262116BA|nr:sensor histidine kinase [uncultured Clostridium sp.]